MLAASVDLSNRQTVKIVNVLVQGRAEGRDHHSNMTR